MMNIETIKLRIFLSLCLALLATGQLTGCSSTAVKPVSGSITSIGSNNPKLILNKSEQRLQQAKSDLVNEFSQVYFDDAVEELETLRKMTAEYNPQHSGFFSSGYSFEDITEQQILVESIFDKAYLAMNNIKTHLQDVLDNIAYFKTIDVKAFQKRHDNLVSLAPTFFK